MKKIVIIVISILFTHVASAQVGVHDSMFRFKGSENSGNKIYFSFGYNQVNGIGKFKKDIDDFIVGFDIKLGKYIVPNTISIGLTAAFQFYEYTGLLDNSIDGLSDYDYVYSSFDQFLGNIKFHSNKGLLMPYIEFSAGVGLFYTSATYDSFFNDEEGDSEWLESSITFLAGLGGGILIKATSLNDDTYSGVFFDLNGKFMFGTEAEFVKNESYHSYNNQLNYTLVNTAPVFVNINIAILIRN